MADGMPTPVAAGQVELERQRHRAVRTGALSAATPTGGGMTVPAIKLCGLTTPETLDAAIAARADHFGLMFYANSPRYAQARGSARARPARPPGGSAGSACSSMPMTRRLPRCRRAGLDTLQLHGQESPGAGGVLLRQRHGLAGVEGAVCRHRRRCGQGASLCRRGRPGVVRRQDAQGRLVGGMGLKFDWSLLSVWKAACPCLAVGCRPITLPKPCG